MTGGGTVATIVVCEDDQSTLGLLCDRLAADRLEPLPASTGEEALRLCRHQRPDLLVVDLELPDGEGPELLRRIRHANWLKTQIDPYLPVIALKPVRRILRRSRTLTWPLTTTWKGPLPMKTCTLASRGSSGGDTVASTSRCR